MAETWYRGQSSTVPPSTPGGSVHDFGDGYYLTSRQEVAEQYAQTRVAHGGGQPEVLTVQINRAELGRVLDLNTDARWLKFVREPQIPGRPDTAPAQLIKMANENYGRFFQQFLSVNKLRAQNFDAVIGPEYVRGGSQLALLHRNGQPTQMATQIKTRLQPATGRAAPRPRIPVVSGRNLAQAGQNRGVLGNQGAMALFGQLLAGALESLGDYLIMKKVEEELETTFAEAIERHLSQGDGVLVIMALEEWTIPDINGMRSPVLISVNIQNGPTQDSALENWRGVPRLLRGPTRTTRIREEYLWIEPAL